MTASANDADRLKVLEARIDAQSALIKSLLTTLVVRGLINRAEVEPLIREAGAGLRGADKAAAAAELADIHEDLPSYLRAAMGPPPGDDDHDH